MMNLGRIPFFDSQLMFTFRSDFIDDAAQGFSIQAIQITDCSTPAVILPALPTPSLKIEDSPCHVALIPPNRDINSANLIVRADTIDLSYCAYSILQQPG